MKSLLYCLCFFTVLNAFSQECDYKVNVTGEDGKELKLTQEEVVFYHHYPVKTDLVYFSLYKEAGIPLLSFRYSRDSKNFIPALCIDSNSRLSFQLANGKIISLRHVGEETCGYSDKLEGSDKNNKTISSYFMLTENDIKNLKESRITMMSLRSLSNEENFVIASELDLGEENRKYVPGNFFINNLNCIE